MIIHFLKSHSNRSFQIHGDLVGYIVSSNSDFMLHRLKTLEEFLIKELVKLKDLNKPLEIPGKIGTISPYIQTFCKCLRLCATEVDIKNTAPEDLFFNVSESLILSLVDFYENCHEIKSQNIIMKLMVTYMFIPKPFKL